MRRAKRQVTDIDLIKKFVDEVEVVRIAINGDKYPYVVPVNFGYSWNDEALSLYIHGASEGKKVSMIGENPLVAVEMDQPDKLIEGNKNASTYSYAYQS
ncbi:pyridoxamine 5'-phosphate oxidase family protein [Lactococcus cremoris]